MKKAVFKLWRVQCYNSVKYQCLIKNGTLVTNAVGIVSNLHSLIMLRYTANSVVDWVGWDYV